MLDHGNAQLSAVGFYNPSIGQLPVGDFFGGGGASSGGRELTPFTVRWMGHSSEDESDGEWQIYVPFGALTVNYGGAGSCYSRSYAALPKNDDGHDADGNTTFQWYKIDSPKSKDAKPGTNGGLACKAWDVKLLIKPWARFTATTEPADDDDPVAWVEHVASIYEAEYNDDDGQHHVDHSVTQLVDEQITESWDVGSTFAIAYELDDEASKNSSYTVKVVNQSKMLGRLQENNTEPVDVKTASSVWVVIKHEGEDYELEVKASTPTDAESNDDQTVYKIYDMKDGVVKADYRNSIPVLPFYTNKANKGNGGGS